MKSQATKPETKKPISLLEWFNGTEDLLKLGFTEKEIEKAIIESGNNVESLTDIQGFQSFPQYFKRAELVQEKFRYYKTNYINQFGKQYENREEVTGIGVRVPAEYQGLKHSKILFTLFSNKWGWFNSFTKQEECSIKKYLSDLPISQIPAEYQNLTPSELRREYLIEKEMKECSLWKIYEMREDGEIYLKTSLGTLYVPIKALANSDFSIIEKRMVDYWSSYYRPNLSGYGLNHRGRTEEQYLADQQKQLDEHLAILKSPEALKLKKLLK